MTLSQRIFGAVAILCALIVLSPFIVAWWVLAGRRDE